MPGEDDERPWGRGWGTSERNEAGLVDGATVVLESVVAKTSESWDGNRLLPVITPSKSLLACYALHCG